MLQKISLVTSFIATILICYFASQINQAIPKPDLIDQDIYYSYVEGQRLVNGENPYARILDGDMRKNRKYATYFPVFYELSYLSQKMGLTEYEPWIIFWQSIFMVFEFGIALILYWQFVRNKMEWIGVFSVAFWVFNRWTVRVVRLANLDFIPVFFLLLSLVIFSKHKWWGLFFFSLSLGLKQVAIFLAPLYLIWVWRQTPRDRIKNTLLAGLVILSIPVISSIPFLLWNAQGLIMSLLFSATRSATTGLGVPSLDEIAGWEGPKGRLVMLGLMAAAYLITLRGYGRKFFSSFFVMSIFLDFNTVLYSQYPCWIAPILPLMLLELNEKIPKQPDNLRK